MIVPPAALPPDHFALLQRVIRSVARVHRLNPEDADDFSQTVHMQLLARGYDVFESYQARSSLPTFLRVVVTRLLLDWRNATRGKWRPSAAALRLGAEAVALERLVHRDGLTRNEAIGILATRRAPSAGGEDALWTPVDKLPIRHRRTIVRNLSEEALGRLEFAEPVMAAEDRRRRTVLRRALRQACASLGTEERKLLMLRYGHAYSIRAIADALATDPKPLYRKLDRALRTLRTCLASQGIDRAATELTV